MNHGDFKLGRVYNRRYVGDNKAYAKINGNETFRVVNLEPLQTEQLFDAFGSTFTPELLGGTVTYHNPVAAFNDFELSEPASVDDWYIHAQIFWGLDAALDAGQLTLAHLAERKHVKSVSCWDNRTEPSTTHFYVCFYFGDGIPGCANPYLQSIFVAWDNHTVMQQDLARFGVEVG